MERKISKKPAVDVTTLTSDKGFTPQPKERKLRWYNGGGNFYLFDKTMIPRHTNFEAFPSQIPKGFRDVIKPLDQLPDESEPLPPPVGTYQVQEREDNL